MGDIGDGQLDQELPPVPSGLLVLCTWESTGPPDFAPSVLCSYTENRITPRVQREAGQQPSASEYAQPSQIYSSIFSPNLDYSRMKECTYLL